MRATLVSLPHLEETEDEQESREEAKGFGQEDPRAQHI